MRLATMERELTSDLLDANFRSYLAHWSRKLAPQF